MMSSSASVVGPEEIILLLPGDLPKAFFDLEALTFFFFLLSALLLWRVRTLVFDDKDAVGDIPFLAELVVVEEEVALVVVEGFPGGFLRAESAF